MMQYVADKKGVTFTRPVVPQDEKVLYSQIYEDKSRFLQVLINFLSNALKFSNPASEIKVNLILSEKQTLKQTGLVKAKTIV